ncbi:MULTISPECIES: hypothetical protein [Acinetobacter]|nr:MULTISPECIES: hypothetical protein [Acinetobacter]UXJ58594.1 hypothetical protein N5P16_06335 [Acinetobacter baylyi]UXJ59905.1 hypothetical protein N5P13_12445 [Acinetobacter baylyi]
MSCLKGLLSSLVQQMLLVKLTLEDAVATRQLVAADDGEVRI